jgi:hypothetical protein
VAPHLDVGSRAIERRRIDREEDVELEMLKWFGLPPEPPRDWKDSLHSG